MVGHLSDRKQRVGEIHFRTLNYKNEVSNLKTYLLFYILNNFHNVYQFRTQYIYYITL